MTTASYPGKSELVHAWGGYGDPRRTEGNPTALSARLYQHRCGAIEEIGPEEIAEMNRNGGGCDHCEAGEDDASGWRPLYRLAASYQERA